MFKMPQAESNNQTNPEVSNTPGQETWREKYNRLTDGQKRRLLQNYRTAFGACKKTFFHKLNNTTRIRPSEAVFFLNHL